jgi:hypothetical protein
MLSDIAFALVPSLGQGVEVSQMITLLARPDWLKPLGNSGRGLGDRLAGPLGNRVT